MLGTIFEPDTLSLALSRLHRLFAWQGLDHQTHLETLLVFRIPNPHLPLCHCPIALMLDQPLQIDFLTIFPFKSHLMVTYTMHSKGPVCLSLLDARSHLVPCIGYCDICCTQVEMMQSLGTVTIGHLYMNEAPRPQVIGTMESGVIPASRWNSQSGAINQQDPS